MNDSQDETVKQVEDALYELSILRTNPTGNALLTRESESTIRILLVGLRDRVKRAESNLQKYGHHAGWCESLIAGTSGKSPQCTCGFNEALL